MKYLGIDYGSKKTGIAISDSVGTTAMSLRIIPSEKLMQELLVLIQQEGITGIVFGESKNLDGSFNSIDSEIKAFAASLRNEVEVAVFFQDERFSSMAASIGITKPVRRERSTQKKQQRSKKISAKKIDIDAGAAAIILQSYLDAHSHS